MTIKGPPPIPTKLKLLQGNRGKQKLNISEPKPRPITPRRPYWLDNTAKRFWGYYVPILSRLGLCTEIDGIAMALLSQTYSDYRACLKTIKKEGSTFTTESGYIVPRPEAAMMRKNKKDIESLLTHFGMTPAARSRLSVDLPGIDDQDFEDLLD